MSGFVCSYCKRRSPDVRPSEAHIVPYVMGGSESTLDTVCVGCNGEVNRLVEMPALDAVLPLQSLFGIRGRRNKVRRVRGVYVADDQRAPVYLDERGLLKDLVVIPSRGADGKTQFLLFGPSDLVETKMKAIEVKYPAIKWEEKPLPEKQGVEVVSATSESVELLRRLAAKVAFERFAQLRSADFVTDSAYDEVRTFILVGADLGTCAGILTESAGVAPLLRPFKPPQHVVYIVSHPDSRVLGAFVIFYGLFFYWVILSRRYSALGATDNVLVQHPQVREVQNPVLRGIVGHVLIDWRRATAPYVKDPVETNKDAGRRAVAILRQAADVFYRSPRAAE